MTIQPEIITLRPNDGDELQLGLSPYHFAGPPDWGEHVIEAGLATGPDIVGGVVGARTRGVRSGSLVILIAADTPAAYLEAATALDLAAVQLARNGGAISTQVKFSDDTLSEELETEVYECNILADPAWRNHRIGAVTLTFTYSPAWLGAEAELGSDSTFTDSVKRLTLSDRRGNLPGPGRVVLTSNTPTPVTYENLVISDLPSLYWRLGTSGTTDLSGNARNGTTAGGVSVGGAAAMLTGDAGASTDFDGNDDRITSTYNPFASSRTFEWWLYRDDTSDYHYLLSPPGDGNPYIRCETGSQDLRVVKNSGTNLTWASFPTAAVTHLVVVVDESTDTIEVFYNGASQGSQAATDGWYATGGLGVELGSSAVTGTFSWNGRVQEFGIYERALTPAEILEHYTTGADGPAITGATARRFVELGGAFDQDPQTVEYLADDFTLGAATLETDADAIGGEALEVTPVLPVWTTVGTLEGLPHAGGFTVRLRTKGGEDDAQFTSRVVVKTGDHGTWQDLEERVETPDAENYYDLPAGVIRHFDAAETIDVRVDVRSSAASSETYSLNGLTITPNELYAVARGVPVALPLLGSDAFDDFADMTAGNVLDDGATPRVAPAGGTWDEAGDSSPEFTTPTDYAGCVTRTAANDSTSTLATGQFVLLGSTDYPAITNTIMGRVEHNGVPTTEAMLGAIVRYVDVNNWLLAAMRVRRQNDGKYINYISLYKRDGGGAPTRLDQWTVSTGAYGPVHGPNVSISRKRYIEGTLSVSVNAAGVAVVSFNGTPVIEFTDSDLATAGSHETGQIGAYSLIQSDRDSAHTRLDEISAYGSVPAFQHTDVIREDGVGVLTHATAYSADTDGSDPQPFTPQGSRIWLPPGTGGEITAKVRSSDSDTQPDTGAGDDTGIAIYHRPAWANLSDALSPDSPLEDLVMI